jgi:AmmeMemoRadiSam system protein B
MAQAGEPVQTDKVVAMLAPHIDYARGGDVYGPIYRYLPRDDNTLFIVFGTCHKLTRRVWSISLKDVVTPLGRIKTAGGVGGLVRCDPLLKDYVDEWPHRTEHSIELQLPLMQFLLEGQQFEVLSILTGSLHEYVQNGGNLDQGEVPALLERLKVLVKTHEGPVVFVAAADLAHIGAQFGDAQPLDGMLEESKQKDGELLQRITAVDGRGFFETVKREGDIRRICGLAPIYFVLSMVDARRGEVIGYKQWTDGASSVSFAGMVFY